MSRRELCLSIAHMVGVIFCVTATRASAAATPQVNYAQIKALVERQLAAKPGYQPGDLISRSQVEPIFNELVAHGVIPASSDERMYDCILPDHDLLVFTFRREAGVRFMRQVSQIPGAYDRLERLTRTPSGRKIFAAMVASPKGPAMFQALSSPDGMKRVGALLAHEPRGEDFEMPTGNIHTADELLRHVKSVVTYRK